MHPAEQYLRNLDKPNTLFVKIDGKKRRLFINMTPVPVIGIIAPGKKKQGYMFHDWDSIEKIYYPEDVMKDEEKRDRMLTAKYKKLASSASFTNAFIRRCLTADESKSPYGNRLTTGTAIDGKLISFKSLERWYPGMDRFREAIAKKQSFHSGRFDYMGYDGSLDVEPEENGDVNIYFSKKYRDACNGYYYLAINDNNFIGYDID